MDISGCTQVDDSGIKWLTACEAQLRKVGPPVTPGLIMLTTLKVSMTKIGDSGMQSIATNCKQLEYLELSRCNEVSE